MVVVGGVGKKYWLLIVFLAVIGQYNNSIFAQSTIQQNIDTADCHLLNTGTICFENKSDQEQRVVFDNPSLVTALIAPGEIKCFKRKPGTYSYYVNPFSKAYSNGKVTFENCIQKSIVLSVASSHNSTQIKRNDPVIGNPTTVMHDNTVVGNPTAVMHDNTVIGNPTTIMHDNTVIGNPTTVMHDNTVIGNPTTIQNTTPVLQDNTTIGNNTTVFGNPTTVQNTTPVSHNNTTIGNNTTVIGNPTTVQNTTPVLHDNTTIGNNTTVIGNPTTVQNTTPVLHDNTTIDNSTTVIGSPTAVQNTTPVLHDNTSIRDSSSVQNNKTVMSNTQNGNNASQTVQAFSLNPNGVSHLYWPFEHSSWDVKNGFFLSCGDGCGLHLNGDYFAQDWVRNDDGHCDLLVLSPISGNIILADFNSCAFDGCETFFKNNSCDGKANCVFIQSDKNPDFIFGVLHLKPEGFIYTGHVNAGQIIGKIGATGTIKSHAHFILYKNVNKIYYNTGVTVKEILDGSKPEIHNRITGLRHPEAGIKDNYFAAEFVFDAKK